ncbi:hypothetical protein BDF19DRAFT_456843, partial [Syncephalis fuscata]
MSIASIYSLNRLKHIDIVANASICIVAVYATRNIAGTCQHVFCMPWSLYYYVAVAALLHCKQRIG